jgi:K+/H+ antiporter YhaU regulatory subunit KhtT
VAEILDGLSMKEVTMNLALLWTQVQEITVGTTQLLSDMTAENCTGSSTVAISRTNCEHVQIQTQEKQHQD